MIDTCKAYSMSSNWYRRFQYCMYWPISLIWNIVMPILFSGMLCFQGQFYPEARYFILCLSVVVVRYFTIACAKALSFIKIKITLKCSVLLISFMFYKKHCLCPTTHLISLQFIFKCFRDHCIGEWMLSPFVFDTTIFQ